MRKDRSKNWLRLPAFSKEFASAALERFESHQKRLRSSRLHDRMQRSWQMYYSRGQNGSCDDTQITFSGDRGEILNLAPANYRRLIQDRISLVQQTPPDFEPRATNTDPESRRQCSLVLGLLDHYKREAHLEEMDVERFEMASVLGASYYHIRWDPQRGKEVGVEDVAQSSDSSADADSQASTEPPINVAFKDSTEPQSKAQRFIYEGDLVFSVRSPYETAFEPTSPDQRKPRWWIVKEPMNRFDLLEDFGGDSEDIRRAIEKAEPWSSYSKELQYEEDEYEFDDSIAVYWVYGERSSGVPGGRKALVLDAEHVLLDGDLDEDRAGVFPLWPSKVIFKPEGHTDNFGGMPVAQAYSAQLSTILSNHATFGLSKMTSPRESGVTMTQLSSGLSLVDYNHVDKHGNLIPKPEVMRQLDSPAELFTMLDVLDALLDKVQGGSAVQRGDPNATKGDSGSKAALLLAQAQQIGARDVRALMRSAEDAATFVVSSIRRHAKTDRIIAITGKNNEQTATEFKGQDLNRIARVTVRQANPARDTFAGRMGMAELLKGLPPEEREQIQGLLLTGRIESVTEDVEAHRSMVDRENEALLDPSKPLPVTLKTDTHLEHIRRHAALSNATEVRNNPAIQARIDAHNAAHLAMLSPMHPDFAGFEVLAVTGQQPIMAPSMGAPSDESAPSGDKSDRPDGEGKDGMPREAQMPKNPATGQRMEGAGPSAPTLNGPS